MNFKTDIPQLVVGAIGCMVCGKIVDNTTVFAMKEIIERSVCHTCLIRCAGF